jgi:hypothetical protein
VASTPPAIHAQTGRSHETARLRERGRAWIDGLRDPEVEHLHEGMSVGLARQEQVSRLEIAMDDLRGVRLRDRFARLHDPLRDLARGKRTACAELGREVAAFEVLHHHERRAVVEHSDVDHARHVLAVDLRGGSRFTREALDDLGMIARLLQEQVTNDESRLRRRLAHSARRTTARGQRSAIPGVAERPVRSARRRGRPARHSRGDRRRR